ncbi:hypothetical protein FRC03_008768 [Tulasnella sp. 419]|nr:hypothetical protein FRC02_004462 [Tulasnella sp. 418]KAG8968069.1 hypothetical protein FRC03_008768 [Tulasnella sp. 419]
MSNPFQNLDSASLILVQTSFAFIVSPFTAPVYNLPLFLFGFYAVDKTDSNDPLRLFSGLLGLSVLFDVIWLMRQDHHALIGFLIVVNMLIKIPTFLSLLAALRHRGDSLGSFGRGEGGSLGGNTVWSMPGAFSANKPGYQNIEDDLEEGAQPATSTRPTAPPPGPSPHSHQSQTQAQIKPPGVPQA